MKKNCIITIFNLFAFISSGFAHLHVKAVMSRWRVGTLFYEGASAAAHTEFVEDGGRGSGGFIYYRTTNTIRGIK